MRIAWAIPCRYAEVERGLGNFLGAQSDIWHPDEVPSDLQIAVAIYVEVPEHELGIEETVDVEILDPGLQVTGGHTFSLRLEDYPHRPAGRQPSLMEVVVVPLHLDDIGQHTIKLTLQGRVTSIPIFILESA